MLNLYTVKKPIKNCQGINYFYFRTLGKKCATTIHNMTETFVNNSKIIYVCISFPFEVRQLKLLVAMYVE